MLVAAIAAIIVISSALVVSTDYCHFTVRHYDCYFLLLIIITTISISIHLGAITIVLLFFLIVRNTSALIVIAIVAMCFVLFRVGWHLGYSTYHVGFD